MTEQQRKAVEEASKRRLISPLSRTGFRLGAEEVINNPEKYGLVLFENHKQAIEVYAAQFQPQWIKINILPPVEEGMSGDLLLYLSKRRDRNCNYQTVGSYEHNRDGEMVWWEGEYEFDWGNQDSWEITHYTFLPQPPKED